jgi:hypothetical protein
MELQPVVDPWPPIIPASILFCSALSASSCDTIEIWHVLFCNCHLFKSGSPYWSIAIELGFQGFVGYTNERESLYMSSNTVV